MGDLCGLQLESRFVTPWRVIFISGMDGYGDVPLSGILLKSSIVKTDLKYLLKISTFSDGSVAVAPSEIVRILIPEMSCHALRIDIRNAKKISYCDCPRMLRYSS